MKAKWLMAVAMVAACFTIVSCGNAKKQQSQTAEETVAAMSIDDVLAKAAGLVEQTVEIEDVDQKEDVNVDVNDSEENIYIFKPILELYYNLIDICDF